MIEKVSEIFMKAFRDMVGSCVLTCVCGRTHFDTYNTQDYDKGEYKKLLEKQAKNQERYISHDGSVSYYIVNDLSIVCGCPCERGLKYENFMREDRHKIAKFLNLLSDELAKDSNETKVKV